MRITRRFLDRRQIKSSEGELLWELENSYSLSEIKFINNDDGKSILLPKIVREVYSRGKRVD